MQVERVQRGSKKQFMPPATKEELEEAVEIAREIRQRERYNRILYNLNYWVPQMIQRLSVPVLYRKN